MQTQKDPQIQEPSLALEVVTDDAALQVQTNNGNNARASWPISLHNLRSNIQHCRPEAKQIIVDCFLWCIQHDITKAEFAAAINVAEITIYKIITGRYVHPETKERLDLSPKHEKAMRDWMREQKALAQKRADFVLTPTARKVITACKLASESRTPVFLFGPSHIGKTWAQEHFAETHNHGRTVYIRLGAASGLGGMLSTIAARIGVSPAASKEKMIKAILGALTSDMLLLLDEVHLLMHTYRKESFFACLEVLREFYDRVGCGMVLSLTDLGRDKIETERRRELQQIFRRGVHRVQLPPMPLQADLRPILALHGLEYPNKNDKLIVEKVQEKPYEILRQLAREDGLKSITERIRYAKILAKKAGRELGWEDFCRAHLIIRANATAQNDWED